MKIRSSLLPNAATTAKLFTTGSLVGPVVDSLHNQCLLEYDLAPIGLSWPQASGGVDYFFCSSWTVPPLLGIAYVVLGGILPRVFQSFLPSKDTEKQAPKMEKSPSELRNTALVAVTTTALIIKLSEILETNPGLLDSSEANILVMIMAAVGQWAILDGTLAALLAATITSVGGPLSELPFVANGFWHYLPEAGDYLPLSNLGSIPSQLDALFSWGLGENYKDLALSSITGPCYFAVTMDAIALGRWFDCLEEEDK
ncbi:unnamed protein product [Heterosigma akashiwo]